MYCQPPCVIDLVFENCVSQTKCFRTCWPKPNSEVQGSSLRNIFQVG